MTEIKYKPKPVLIKLKPETRTRLANAGTHDETYDDIVNGLLDFKNEHSSQKK